MPTFVKVYFFLISLATVSLLFTPALAICGADSALVDIAPTLALSVCSDWQPGSPSPAIVRVVRTPSNSESTAAQVTRTRDSLMVQPSWPPNVPKFKVDRSHAGLLTISTSRLVVTVDLDSLSIQFLDPLASEAPFLVEQSHAFAPDTDAASGAAAFAASSVWQPATESEALYGGGSFQSGFVDFRNVPVNLVQFNTEVIEAPRSP
jgi:hypothetical protein